MFLGLLSHFMPLLCRRSLLIAYEKEMQEQSITVETGEPETADA